MTEIDLQFYIDRSKDWISNSAVSRTFPPSFSHSLRKNHGGIKPPELLIELISAYGSNSKNVIDPFAGVGSTLIAASLLKKSCTGIDINQEWQYIYYQVCKENNVNIQNFVIGDSSEKLKGFDSNSFDFLITDVPYFSMDKLKKTRGRFSKAGESSKDKLKSSLNSFNDKPIPSITDWKKLLFSVFNESFRILKPDSFVLIFIGNMYRNFEDITSKKKKVGKYLLLSSEIAELMLEIGFQQTNELIWIDTGKKLGIYGYPYTWIPSLIDQRILVFQK
jgi:DNA modification methylase